MRRIMLLTCFFIQLLPLHGDFEIMDRIQLSDMPGYSAQIGENDYIGAWGRTLTRYSLESDTVEVQYSLIGDNRFLMCFPVCPETLFVPTLRHGVEVYRCDDNEFQLLGEISHEQYDDSVYWRVSTAYVNHTLFQCLYRYPISGEVTVLWSVDDVSDPLAPQTLQVLDMPADRYFSNVFYFNNRFYIVEYENTVSWCDDLSSFVLHEAIDGWPTGQQILSASMQSDVLYLVTQVSGEAILRAYAPLADGSLLLIGECGTPVYSLANFCFDSDSIILAGSGSDGYVRICRFQCQNDELTLVNEADMPDDVTYCRLLPIENGYLAYTSSRIYRMDSGFNIEEQIFNATCSR